MAAAPIVGVETGASDGSSSPRFPYKPEGVSAQPHPVAPAGVAHRAWLEGTRGLADFGTAAVMIIAPLLLLAFIAGDVWNWHRVARTPVDFHIFWIAGQHYLHGQSPYGHSLSEAFVYPPPAALLFAPLGMAALPRSGRRLSCGLAGGGRGLSVASRCARSAAVRGHVPFSSGVDGSDDRNDHAAASPWPCGGLAFRNHRGAAIPVALLIVLKLFLWPVLVWLLVTGRKRAAVEAVVLSLALTFVSWAWIGFADIGSYPSILDRLAGAEGAKSYALASGRIGEPLFTGVVIASLWIGRRLGERRLFATAIVGATLASPIVWLHYFALLTIVFAVLEAPLIYWLIPALLWVTPLQQTGDTTWRVALAAGVCALSLFARPGRPPIVESSSDEPVRPAVAT